LKEPRNTDLNKEDEEEEATTTTIAAPPNKNCEWEILFIHTVFIFTQNFPSVTLLSLLVSS